MAQREYLAAISKRYRKAQNRKERSKLLDEICATLGCHRKHATRLVRKRPRRTLIKPRGRPVRYSSPTLVRVLETIWIVANFPCSTRLAAMVPHWVGAYERRHGALDADVRAALSAMSESTIKRLLKRSRTKHKRTGRATTKPGTLLRHTIPIATGQWSETRPGFLEADTVAHCGTSMAGHFVYTLDCVDIATGWSEQRAVWNKRDLDVVKQMKSIERALPFPVLGFDCDNGSEFINHRLLAHFINRHKPVQFTRSRAYRKDDNAHIEQKNWTHVRQWIGYDRFDNPTHVDALNALYSNEWRLFHNLYCPSTKLLSKERLGSKTAKTYDKPKTPYQRVLESSHVSDDIKQNLQRIYERTDPFVLRRAIDQKIAGLFRPLRANVR